MLSSEPKAEADNIYQDLDFQERSVHTYIRPYARAYSWILENIYFPENMFLALNGDDW